MQIFLLLTVLLCRTYSQTVCDSAYTSGDCDGIAPAASAPCGCTWDPEEGGDVLCYPTDPCPTTTSTAPTTTSSCFCATNPPGPTTTKMTTTPLPKSKAGKTSGGSGLGIGECDCSGGVAEIRYVYQGTELNVNIKMFNKESSVLICEYNNINPNDEIICNLRGDADGLVITPNSMAKFETETPFIITYTSGGECSAQYHTSCSSDIVGIPEIDCPELIVSGWRDNDGYANGDDCDDGFEPCECSPTSTTTGEGPPPEVTTTATPFIDIIIGDVCYCSTQDASITSTTTTPVPNSKSKAGKSKHGDSGLGIGDCDCTNGQIDLTVMYQGTNPNTNEVSVKCFNRKDNDGDLITDVNIVAIGEEFTCTVSGTQYSKLGTETLIILYNSVTNEEICNTQIHTSCSRDIVGTYGATSGQGIWCDNELIVTGWRDGNNINPTDPTFNDGCDDGFEECPCDGIYVEQPPNPIEKTQIEIVPGICICSSQDQSVLQAKMDAYLQSQTTVRRRRLLHAKSGGGKSRNRDNGWGFGNCDCNGGLYQIRFFYKGFEQVNIEFWNKNQDVMICEKLNVNQGDENYCSIKEFPLDSNNDPIFEKYETDTYVKIFDMNGNQLCNDDGKLHTSCSQDIIGWTPNGCENIIISGWNDNNNNECDDGFYPCDCDVFPCGTLGGEGYDGMEDVAGTDCNAQTGCQYDDNLGECLSVLTGNSYQKSVMVGIIIGWFIALL